MSSVPRSCFVWLSPLFVLAVSGATLAQEKVPPAAAGTPDGFRREMRFLDLNADRSIDAEELAIGREMAAVIRL